MREICLSPKTPHISFDRATCHIEKRYRRTMARKCKRCSTDLHTADGHVFCSDCRANKKGDDPCTKGKSCKLCERLSKFFDENPKEAPSSKNKEVPLEASGSSKPSVEDSLASLSSQITGLASKLTSLEHVGLVGRSTTGVSPLDKPQNNSASALNLDLEPSEQDLLADEDWEREPEASYVEMLQAVKSLLKLPDPEVEQLAAPSAFRKKIDTKVNKKQISAFPPDENLDSMWEFRSNLASGKESQGLTKKSPLHVGQFLTYNRLFMQHYLSVPQKTTLKAQKVPESYHNLAREKLPNSVDLPWKQSERDEKSLRETVQVLERLVYFIKAQTELNSRVHGFINDAKLAEVEIENLDAALTAVNMQTRLIDSVETSIEHVLNHVMTNVCNITLARRDTLLKNCKNLSFEDQLMLRNASFTESDLFPNEAINMAENNMLKRSAISKNEPQAQKRQKMEENESYPNFRAQSNFRGRGRGYNQNNYNQSRGSFRGRGRGRGRGRFTRRT